MRTTDTARIKKMLSGPLGKRLRRAGDEWMKLSLPIQNKDSRKAVTKLLGSEVIKAPVRKAFADILAADKTKQEAAAKKMRAQALKTSSAAAKSLKQLTVARVKAVQGFLAQPADTPSPELFLLERPIFIIPSPGTHLDNYQYADLNSWATLQSSTDASRIDTVRFYYIWSNPRSTYSVVNVDGFIVFNGYCGVGTNGGIFPDDRYSQVIVNGVLEVYQWWIQPPVAMVSDPNQTVSALNLKVTSGGWFDVGAIGGRNVYRGYDLRADLVVVAPQATLVFAVTATIGQYNNSGHSYIDFSNKDYQITSPFVIVSLVS